MDYLLELSQFHIAKSLSYSRSSILISHLIQLIILLPDFEKKVNSLLLHFNTMLLENIAYKLQDHTLTLIFYAEGATEVVNIPIEEKIQSTIMKWISDNNILIY